MDMVTFHPERVYARSGWEFFIALGGNEAWHVVIQF